MSKTTTIIFTGLILGLGWAIRGHFGHEWGAAWAGVMGGLAMLVAAKRKDWWQHAPVLSLLAGVGWAVGGMMSYGLVVGYCKGPEFGNVAYGYAMLALIGGLYGCIGGGLFGLGLASHPQKRPNWAALLTEMVAGAWISWGFLIYQMEWFMTPPRSELWAACLGAAAALLWYLYRNAYFNAFRVALYAALGAGFGFSFGNFIQTLGNASGLSYNWWNVMEFTLGFCGGAAMAYGVHTSKWADKGAASANGNLAALLTVFFAIPLTNFSAAFSTDKLSRLATAVEAANPESFMQIQRILGGTFMLLFTLSAFLLWPDKKERKKGLPEHVVPGLLFTLSLYYILFAFIVKGIFYQPLDIGNSVMTYIPLLLVSVAIWWGHRQAPVFRYDTTVVESWQRGWNIAGLLILAIVIFAFISINAHDGLSGFQERF